MDKAHQILVWDVPTRVFHWLLAASFLGAFVTADSERLRDVHVAFGYTLLGLVGFRLFWGFAGTRYARFRSFAFGPSSVLSYLRSLLTSSPRHYQGHNPAGSWAIYALLGLITLTGVTGYLTYNDYGGGWLEEAHEALASGLLAVVAVHIAGVIASSLLHRENLVRAMISGLKRGKPADGARCRHRLVGAALFLAVAAFWVAGSEPLPASWSSQPQAAAAPAPGEHRGHN